MDTCNHGGHIENPGKKNIAGWKQRTDVEKVDKSYNMQFSKKWKRSSFGGLLHYNIPYYA